MKKQILFLFAASALFAACSSDEIPGNNNQGGDDNGQTVVEEVTNTSVSVTTEEGYGMTVAATNGIDAETRASDDSDYFRLELPDDILGEWEGYVAKADDFYIYMHKDGEKKLMKTSNEGQETNWAKFTVKRNEDLTLTITGINATDAYATGMPVEYTFETYIWIENVKGQTTGDVNGIETEYFERFTYPQKLSWIGLDADATITEKTERGIDLTTESGPYKLAQNVTSALTGKKFQYIIRYNVYRGLQGTPTDENGETDEKTGLGNTPDIKVSIHTVRVEDLEESQVIAVPAKKD